MNDQTTIGYARSGIVPLRRTPDDASEQQTQLLLGETFRILEVRTRWFKVLTDFDEYEGWINRTESATMTREEYDAWIQDSDRICSPCFTYRVFDGHHDALMVPPGARVVELEDQNKIRLPCGTYSYSGKRNSLKEEAPIDTAHRFLGTPYLWGGRTDVGVDCSGLIQTAFLLHGKTIPCDSWKQEEFFENHVTNLQQARRGDIIFFNPKGNSVSHVGFYLGEGGLLHASGRVKINLIDKSVKGKYKRPFNQRLADSIFSIYRP